MHSKLILIPILLIGICQGDLNSELDEMIASIFDTTAGPDSVHNSVPVTPQPESTTPFYKKCGKGKVCVPAYLCFNGKVISNGASILDIRGYSYGTPSSGEDDTTQYSRMEDDIQCPFLQTCCFIDNDAEKPRDEIMPSCGYRNIQGVDLVEDEITDIQAKFGEFPWMVGVCVEQLFSGRVNHVYHAGGSLITPKVVLTAAHRVLNRTANSLNVRAGEWDSSKQNELYPHQDRKVVEVVVHEQFNNANLQNDIALLFLESPFEMAPNVNTVCLPPAGLSFDFARCYFTGWGTDQFHNGRYQNILKKIDLPIVPIDQCQEKWSRVGLRSSFGFHSSHLCAGGEHGKDACIGDGGSPLVCPINSELNRYYQAGIVSGGMGCGRKDVPGLYANLSQLRAWIDEQLAKKGIDSKYFTP